jgi:c-di-GMP-binding flagellar brake protein YcgR
VTEVNASDAIRVLSVGSPVELDVTNGPSMAMLEGVVVMTSADRVALRCALSRNANVTVESGTSVSVHVIAGSSITTFESTIVNVTRETGAVVIAVEPPDKTVEERREFFRLAYQMPVELSGVGERGGLAGSTIDVSGGGIGVLCPEAVAGGSSVKLHLELEDGTFVAPARVVRSLEVADQDVPAFRLGLEFDRLDEHDRCRIVQFIFAKQQEYRRKGVL